jgi:hypothetical protein
MKHRLLLPVIALTFLLISCSKSNSSPSTTTPDYSGTYAGNEGSLSIAMQVFKGDTPGHITILYGGWSTPATLSGSSFTITPTKFGTVEISGSGSFSGNNMNVSYIEPNHTITATLVKQ